MSKRLTDSVVKSLSIGKKRSEQVDPIGSLLVKRTKQTTEFYYRLRKDGSDDLFKIGNYPSTPLVSARKQAHELAIKANNSIDLKYELAVEKDEAHAAYEADKANRIKTQALGTLADLCRMYVTKLENEKKISAREVSNSFSRYLLSASPALAELKAKDVTSDQIAVLMRSLYSSGLTTAANRFRDSLHAAYNYGLKYDYDWSSSSNVRFEIEFNPVSRVPKQKSFERQLDRALTAEELKVIWPATYVSMNDIYAALLRILICTGLHPSELLRLQVGDVDLSKESLYLKDPKNKNLPNLVPLNSYAITELTQLMVDRDKAESLFPSRVLVPRSDSRQRASVLANQVKKLRKYLGDSVEHFTARDIRRTVKTRMGEAGISKEIRDRLQNHATSDVSSKHYDRYDYWPEKYDAMKKWERWMTLEIIELIT
ncbi:site-specific tyrosine recombinase XerD [Marinobacterium sp. xm-d-420]|uniref:tyrosine-type recombinase/integrase n=1 Tax=Marinobacterium sp. xm-d-420 TaxID=2497737 RepID=UPI00156A2CE6|nr:tyrosine-type recombinase/integrase [Marinobacterium sp. xm-d-420]NRP27356.1 site-specific tyrosine recombinase XerD [Marinobacterium sp. xm-d-420]